MSDKSDLSLRSLEGVRPPSNVLLPPLQHGGMSSPIPPGRIKPTATVGSLTGLKAIMKKFRKF